MRISLRIRALGGALLLALASVPRTTSGIDVAGELLVDLSAESPSAAEAVWENTGTLGDFTETDGDALLEVLDGVTAVTFDGLTAYVCADNAPAGIVGLDPTRTIEVWAYNPDILPEETLVAWGRRGGGPGTNMSFNYGSHAAYGAVGHWDAPDIGWGTVVPAATAWHHLTYTYDGTTTRVYADGLLANSEVLGAGIINTHAGTEILLGAQWANETTIEPGLRGSLSLARVRVHDGVLTDAQVYGNFAEEAGTFGLSQPAVVSGIPATDGVLRSAGTYSLTFGAQGLPIPTVTALQPPGATIAPAGLGRYTYSYTLPNPAPASFTAGVRASNTLGDVEVFWDITVFNPQPGVIEVAEELLVDLDAADPTAGTATWENRGVLGPFTEFGDPQVTSVVGTPAVTFNGSTDYYQGVDLAPEGITGIDPTRSIEVWTFNPSVPTEETLVSWGRRAGPAGTNMSFNYGTDPNFGAVGHWDAPDIGWMPGGGAPVARQWHHMVYTYDGTTTRVYADGVLTNSEVLGSGVINTHADTQILLAAQWAGVDVVEPALRGSLSLGRVRIHDGVLFPQQVLHNYETEKGSFGANAEPPVFINTPTTDNVITGSTTYTAYFGVDGLPTPTVSVVAPVGATLTQNQLSYTLQYTIPNPAPAFIAVRVEARNDVATTQAFWRVNFVAPPARGAILSAGDVFVNVRGDDPTAGEDLWANAGTLSDLVKVGNPIVTDPVGVQAVTFNCAGPLDAYQTPEDAPAGLIGTDATRSIEVWAFNPQIAMEETLVSWGRRGGPDGSNMSFNYGTHNLYGAVGHWGGNGPDIGWNDAGGAPAAGQWHHLVYTYDGVTTRVYADGALANFEDLGPGAINTHPGKINLAAQVDNADGALNAPLVGTLSMARVRIHDGVLSPYQVLNNYLAEKDDFPLAPPPPVPVPEALTAPPVHRYPFTDDTADVIGGADGTAYGNVTIADGRATLGNDGTQNSNANGQSPPAEPPGAYIDLPNGIISALGNNATFECWVTWGGAPGGSVWQRIFDFGNATGGEDFSDGGANTDYIFLTPSNGGTMRCGYRDGVSGVERNLDAPILSLEPDQHIVITWAEADVTVPCSGTTVALYVNGQQISVDSAAHITLAQIPDVNNWLGRSQWPDALFNGAYNEFRIYDYPLTANQVFGNFQAGPDTVTGPGVEICNNGADDDGDSQIDCDDTNCASSPLCTGGVFHRGDSNNDGRHNISDPVNTLNVLFLGTGLIPCQDAADSNDDGKVNISDPVNSLNVLFLGTGAVPPPLPPEALLPCGPDPTADLPEDLGCVTYTNC